MDAVEHIYFTVVNQDLERTDNQLIAANAAGTIAAHFDFSDEWGAFVKFARFTCGNALYDMQIEDSAAVVPHEVLKADSFELTVYGTDGSGYILTSDKVTVPVSQSVELDCMPPMEPTPELWEQVAKKAQDAADSAESSATSAANAETSAQESATSAAAAASSASSSAESAQSAATGASTAAAASNAAAQSAESAAASASSAAHDAAMIARYAVTSENYDFGFVHGALSSLGWHGSVATRIISKHIPVNAGDIVTVGNNGNILSVYLYDLTGQYVAQLSVQWTNEIVIPSKGLIIILLRKADDSDIDESEIATIAGKVTVYSSVPMLEDVESTFTQNSAITPKWGYRTWNFSNHTWETVSGRIGMREILTAEKDLLVSVEDGYKWGYGTFSGLEVTSGNQIMTTGWLTEPAVIPKGSNYLINFAKTDNANIPTTDSVNLKFSDYVNVPVTTYLAETTWRRGTFNANGTSSAGNGAISQIIANLDTVKLNAGCRAVLALYRGNTYIGKVNSSGGIDKIAGNWKFYTGNVDVGSILVANSANGALLCMLPTDGTTVTEDNVQTWADAHCEFDVSKYAFYLSDADSGDMSNYSIGADFVKRGLTATLLGNIANLQSFCVYGGKYYSVAPDTISVQDSSFNVEQTANIDVGHGNSLQLGSNGKAYASGWNDNKVYVVNLETLAVDDSIELPTTGYTTAAIDDLNQIAYIFQRDSYPDTVVNYNFIVYDYANEQIITTRKIRAFAAMQACDYYEGKIAVMYGLGTTAVPSGMFVCNTAGDIITEIVLEVVSATEPEGVCFDRETGNLLISTVNKSLYKIEQA